MDESRGLFITIPMMVCDDKRLSPSAKLLYGYATTLAYTTGYCYASNGYFAKKLDTSERTVMRLLAELKECGYITTEVTYKKDSKEVDRRYIYASVDARVSPRTPLTKLPPPSDEDGVDNNISIISPNSITEYDVHSDITKRAAIPKHAYGSFKNVLLSDDQLANLKAMFSDYEQRIESMSVYCSANGKGYKNYYAALLNWNRMESQRKKNALKDKWEGHEY